MMKVKRQAPLLAALSLAIALGGCATTRSAQGTGDPDLLTRDQIMSVEGVTNLYDVVQRLRPRWLTVRAENRSFDMTTEIAVYQDQTYLGNTDTLRQLQPGMAYQLRWMDGTDAMNKLPGLGQGRHVAGAIIMSTRAPKAGG